MKTIAIVQARMGSARFPAKVMKPIIGVPMIELLLNRLAKAKGLERAPSPRQTSSIRKTVRPNGGPWTSPPICKSLPISLHTSTLAVILAGWKSWPSAASNQISLQPTNTSSVMKELLPWAPDKNYGGTPNN